MFVACAELSRDCPHKQKVTEIDMLNKWHLRSFGLAIGLVVSVCWVARVDADAPPGQYTIVNGTVRDTKSKLTWQQNAESPQLSWSAAQTYCQNLALDGGGWRMPSANELMSIVDETRQDPSIDTNAFLGTTQNNFWTSSPNKGKTPTMWTIDFFTGGFSYAFDPATLCRVRCVR